MRRTLSGRLAVGGALLVAACATPAGSWRGAHAARAEVGFSECATLAEEGPELGPGPGESTALAAAQPELDRFVRPGDVVEGFVVRRGKRMVAAITTVELPLGGYAVDSVRYCQDG